MGDTIATRIARLIQARENCQKSGNAKWGPKCEARAEEIAANHLPSGSGIDAGTKIDWDKSTPEKLVLIAPFHHMDERGCYAGWSEHSVVVRASLAFGLDIRVTGRNRNEIKDYLAETFAYALTREIES